MTTITVGTATLTVTAIAEAVESAKTEVDLWISGAYKHQVTVLGAYRMWTLTCVEKDVTWASSAVKYFNVLAQGNTPVAFVSDDPRRPVNTQVRVTGVESRQELTGTVNIRYFTVTLQEDGYSTS